MTIVSRLVFTTLVLFVVWTSGAASAEWGPEVALAVHWETSRPTILNMTLTSNSTEDIEVFESDLPWGNHRSMMVEAVLTRNGVALEKYFPIDDPGGFSTRIPARGVLKGEIDMRHRFADAEELLGTREIVLFWSYQFRTKEGKESQRIGGWVLASPGQKATVDDDALQ